LLYDGDIDHPSIWIGLHCDHDIDMLCTAGKSKAGKKAKSKAGKYPSSAKAMQCCLINID